MAQELSDKLDKYEPIDIKDIKKIKDKLLSNNIPLFRLNRDNDLVLFPTEQIDLILDNEKYANMPLYIPKNYYKFFEEFKIAKVKKSNQSSSVEEKETKRFKTPQEAEKEMGSRLSELSKMPYREKVDILESYNKDLINLGKDATVTKELAQRIVDIGNDAGLIAKISMFESIQQIKRDEITQEEAKKENQEMTKKTTDLVSTIVDMLAKNTETQKVFKELKHYSDGGVMSHCNRVFVSYINFLAFYNTLVNRMHLAHKVRSNFQSKYKKYYVRILQSFNKDRIIKELNVVEDCIDKGLRGLSDANLYMYAVGALLHDVGKVKDLSYFEGATGRDMERIKKHLFNSYALVTQTAEYPLEVILTVAFHHEYYGFGYGPFEHFYELKRIKYPQFRVSNILTYDAKVVDSSDAFAYFPAKMLEIIDVYDALIDPARKYRGGKTFTPIEALTIMREDFIEKEVKLDPILFDVFVEFLSNSIEQDMLNSKVI